MQRLRGAFEAASADLDGDEDLDVVVSLGDADITTDERAGNLLWFENSGDPSANRTSHVLRENRLRVNQGITADIDGDGRPDIVAGSERGSNEVRGWRRRGNAIP